MQTRVDKALDLIASVSPRHENAPIIVSYGGGMNSTALLVWMVAHGHKPDLILFADTGGEHPYTYEYIEIISDWLESKNFPRITIVRRHEVQATRERNKILVKSEYKNYSNLNLMILDICSTIIRNVRQDLPYGTLEEECFVLQSLPSKAFGMGTCSANWKIYPQRKYVENYMIAKGLWNKKGRKLETNDIKPRYLVGIHIDESSRLFDNKGNPKPLEDETYVCEYPLIENKITQQHCEMLIAAVNLPKPGKSSCFFCPAKRASDVLTLKKQYPELYERAMKIEENAITQIKTTKGLGRSFAWRDVETMSNLEKTLIDTIKSSRTCSCID